MNRCVLILPYFGEFNNYFPLFLKSCGSNKDYDYPDNVKIVPMSLKDFKDIAAEKLGFSPCIPRPYKLCDFKPAYGLIVEDYIQGYEYWGHCDCDLLFGNLSDILTPILDLNYDKIFAVGHLTIYKNTYENNRIFMREHNGVLLYRNVFTSERIWGFDESQCDLGGNNVHEIFKQSMTFLLTCIRGRMRLLASNITHGPWTMRLRTILPPVCIGMGKTLFVSRVCMER